jgi:predicted carbohydrate-binding protein with CBM5 and CBM33 domain
MRRSIAIPSMAAAAIVASLLVAPQPAMAHGYVSSPPSRQAMCAQGRIDNCGPIIYEPQSVEALKGSMLCSGGSRFRELDANRAWPRTSVGGGNVRFTWTLTAAHRTTNWEYFIGGTRIANFNDGGAQPPFTVSHNVNLGGRRGAITVLARWNIFDTAMAFYACVDLQVGGGGGNPPPPPPPPPNPPPGPPPPPPPPPPSPGGTWRPNTAYSVGSTVTYGGASYRCVQAHTSLPGWEPPNVPALWARS